MKKILAVLSVVGIAAVLTGCNNMKVDNFQTNIDEFKEHVSAYTDIGKIQSAKTNVGKYVLTSSLASENEDLLKQTDPILRVDEVEQPAENEMDNEINFDESQETNPDNELNQPKLEVGDVEIDQPSQDEQTEITPTDKQISTLYSLSSDIDDCCENFVTLKQNITDAILETQNLINKVNNKEVELTAEQKMLITEQSKQLKDLGRQLARTTTELSLSLSDLNSLMLNNGDLNTLSLKYLIVLDNLVNGNEMLENGLHSLQLINSMFNTTRPLPPNNTGRILYGFRRNNEDPVIKDYLIDENGNIKENTDENVNQDNQTENSTTEISTEPKEEKGIKNIDTMQNSQKMNIDSYNTNNRHNVDSFFNTALLDNEFMYGNGYGYGPMANGGLMYGYGDTGYNQPYNNGYAQNANQLRNNNNTNNGVFNADNTQHNEQTNNQNNKQKSKKFSLTKNVDSYKDANTPTLSTRFGKIKNAVSGFFNKFHKKNKENPVYRFNPDDDELNN